MRSLMELHYAEDMSLAEIAEQENISRQAVYDSIHRGVKALMDYESKLGLIERFTKQQQAVHEAVIALENKEYLTAHTVLTELMNTL
jgi:hypothetical protein